MFLYNTCVFITLKHFTIYKYFRYKQLIYKKTLNHTREISVIFKNIVPYKTIFCKQSITITYSVYLYIYCFFFFYVFIFLFLSLYVFLKNIFCFAHLFYRSVPILLFLYILHFF